MAKSPSKKPSKPRARRPKDEEVTSVPPVTSDGNDGTSGSFNDPEDREDRLYMPERSLPGPVTEPATWRLAVKNPRQVKFDDEMKYAWFKAYAECGGYYKACRRIGISYFTFNQHLDLDPEFKRLVELAEQVWCEKVHDHAMDLMFNGVLRKKYDKDGNLIEEYREYPLKILELEMKKTDERYREKGPGAGQGGMGGGVVLIPTDVPVDQLLQSLAERDRNMVHPDQRYIEAEFEEVPE